MFRLLQPRFILAFLRGLLLKLRYGSALQFNPARTFFGPNVTIQITAGGSITISGTRDRVFIADGCDIVASGGHLSIGNGVFFNKHCRIVCHERIAIGEDCMFGPNCSVFDSDHVFQDPSVPYRYQGYTKKAVQIGDNTWLGVNAVVTKGTCIGSGVVVGANSVVRGILDAACVYGGSPAVLLKRIAGTGSQRSADAPPADSKKETTPAGQA